MQAPRRPRTVRRALVSSPPLHVFVIINQDSLGCAVEILELPAPCRPEERGQRGQSQSQRNRQEKQDFGHRAAHCRRSELATTMIELPDIASAAINGVISPAMASGTASAL